MDESVKFAWAYLLTYGQFTNGKWCQYGGWEHPKGGGGYTSWDEKQSQLAELRDKVTSIGIDWVQTSVPTVSEESEFNDTNSPNTERLATLGTLYLQNGEKFLLGSTNADAAHLAETAREMIKGTSAIQELASKL